MRQYTTPSSRVVVSAVLVWLTPGSLLAQVNQGEPQASSLFRLDAKPQGNMVAARFEDADPSLETVQASESVLEDASAPFSFSINYTLMSDYIFRGINFSEFPGEGHEDLNHQMGTSLGVSLGDWGSIGFDTWFEWFAGQEQINPRNGDDNLQEVDFVVYWSYDLESIDTALTIGWTYFLFPNTARTLREDASKANNNDDRTHEWWFSLEHNDAWMWRWLWADNEDGILNPSFFFSQDIGIGSGTAIWMELGLSHEFALAENVTVTPSWTLGIDHSYYHYFAGARTESTRLANMLWGLDVSYDLNDLLSLSETWGDVTISGLLFFSDALGNPEDNGIIQDEFFGGVSLAYSYGG